MGFFKNREIEDEPVYVFDCTLLCMNCKADWEEQFEKGDEVVQEGEQVIVGEGKNGIVIKCPNCSSKKTMVTERQPRNWKNE